MLKSAQVSCKDCRHFINDCWLPGALKYGKCRVTRNENAAKIDPVDGNIIQPVIDYSYASSTREYFGECGPEGKLFELETDVAKVMQNRYSCQASTFTRCVGAILLYEILSKYVSAW